MKNKEELEKKTGVKKFDICLMNPPYDNRGMYLDMQFVEKVNEISNIQIVIHPAKKWVSNTNIAKRNAESGHLKELEIIDANNEFDIATWWRWAGIFVYDNLNTYENTIIKKDNINNIYSCELNYTSRKKIWEQLMFPQDFLKIAKSAESLRNNLINKYKRMIDDGHGFIYEENAVGRHKTGKKGQQKLERVKKYLKEGTYKYCLYKGSYNHDYDEVKEWTKDVNPDKLFKGQICWLCNDDNVYSNMKYWMNSPLFDFWKRYTFKDSWIASNCMYYTLPALPFDKPEDEFRKMVNDLNSFTKEEIEILQKNNIHNADKLKPNK